MIYFLAGVGIGLAVAVVGAIVLARFIMTEDEIVDIAAEMGAGGGP